MKPIICPTCKQDLREPPHDGLNNQDCPQCGQGRSQRKKVQTIKAWGGFCDGELHSESEKGYDKRRYAVFKTRADARPAYMDVRPVKIIMEDK